MNKINKKYLAWLIILIILVNISFISALIIDQYVTSESVSYSRHNNDHSQTQDYGATAKMDFKKDSVTGWNGSGTYIISDGSYSTSYGDDSTWENTNITCNLGNCIKRTYMWSYSDNNYPKESESFKEEQIDTSRNWEPSYSIESSASVAVTRICDCAGATDNFEYLTNCRGYDQYGGKINPDYERYGSASCTENDMYSEKDHCSYNFDITHKEGFCCNYDQYTDGNMNSEDFVCDFDSTLFNSAQLDSYGYPFITKPQDGCRNQDTDGKLYDYLGDKTSLFSTSDACCPAKLGDAAKYVVPFMVKEGWYKCSPHPTKQKCVDGCTKDSDCPGENQACCKGNYEEKGTCYTKKHLVGEKYVGEKCCSDPCGSEVCKDWRYECYDKDKDGRALECKHPCENSCNAIGKYLFTQIKEGDTAKSTAEAAIADASYDSLYRCKKDENTQFPPFGNCNPKKQEECCNTFESYQVTKLNIWKKEEDSNGCIGGEKTISLSDSARWYNTYEEAQGVLGDKLAKKLETELSAFSCGGQDCTKEVITKSGGVQLNRVQGKWEAIASGSAQIKCMKSGKWEATAEVNAQIKCAPWKWYDDAPKGCSPEC